MPSKRIRVFAGPNGSGKSSVYNDLKDKFNFGIYINADDIERLLCNYGKFCFADYAIKVESDFLEQYSLFFRKIEGLCYPENVTIESNTLLLVDKNKVDSYIASFIASYLREKMVCGSSCKVFTIETVMSHDSKLAFLQKAKNNGYKVYLYFVTTISPEINKDRVSARVAQGGHGVSEEKIENRYYRSLDLLYQAILLSDRTFVFDNSGKKYELLAEYDASDEGGDLAIYKGNVPQWFDEYVLKKLQSM